MRKLRYMAAALCAVVLLCGMAIPALAFVNEGEDAGEPEIVVEETPEPVEETPVPVEEYVEEATGGLEWEELDPTELAPLTPSGTGTLVDNVTDENGKEFFTIEAADGSVFYLVIDRQRSTENVYFLDAVTVSDLMPLAELTLAAEPTPTPTPEVQATFEPSVTPIPSTQTGGDLALDPQMLMIVGLVAVIVIIVALLVKGRRSKEQATEQEDYPDDEPEPDYGPDYGADYDVGAYGGDLPWEEDGGE